jgi:signal transduction histidine kinase
MGMSIKARIYLFQLIVGISVFTIAAVVLTTIRQTEYYLQRVEWTNHQLEAITALTVNANRFSEQIAEYLLIGEPERRDFESARQQVEAGFDKLEEVSRGETAYLVGKSGEAREQLDETYRLQRMRAVFAEIDRVVADLVVKRNQGQQEEAVLQFRRDIENRLDAEFESLLTEARLDETEEVHRAERDAEALWRRLGWITAVSAIFVISLCVASGLLLARSLTKPIRLLTKGTEAISRGELEHRIPYDSHDELGALARSFNEMAARRQEQRALLLAAQSDLERQVAKRTEELASANKRLTDLDRARVQFLADISHELRTPLTALRGEAEVTLRHGPKQEKIFRDTLERIVAQSLEMSRLVDDLLFLARSETDTIRFDLRRVILQDIVADAVRENEVLGRNKNIAIRAEYPPHPVWVEADEQRVKQTLVILLDNAIKYSPRGRSVLVRVAGACGFGEVAVRDQGMGIPADELPHVFERFYRGRASDRAGRKGSGLGLAIAKWLIDKQGGQIAIASKAGSFTEAVIRMPQAEEEMLLAQDSAGGR